MKTLFLFAALVALAVGAPPEMAASQFSQLSRYRVAPELPAPAPHLLKNLCLQTKEGAQASIAKADSVLQDPGLTTPSVRQAIQTWKAMAAIAQNKQGDAASALVALYDAPNTCRPAVIHCLPAILELVAQDKRLATLEAVRRRVESDEFFTRNHYALTYDMARAVVHASGGDVDNTLKTLESIVHTAAPGYFDAFRTTVRNNEVKWPYIPLRRSLLPTASPGQLERMAAVEEAWAAIVEAKVGRKAEAWVTGAQLRGAASETRRLATVKRAVLEAAAKMKE